MRSRKVHSVASLSVAVVAGLCFSVAVFAMEKAKTSQEEVVTAALRAHVAEGLQIDPAAVTIRIMSPLDRVEIGPAMAIRNRCQRE